MYSLQIGENYLNPDPIVQFDEKLSMMNVRPFDINISKWWIRAQRLVIVFELECLYVKTYHFKSIPS